MLFRSVDHIIEIALDGIENEELRDPKAVSYTHLDVYKRQYQDSMQMDNDCCHAGWFLVVFHL